MIPWMREKFAERRARWQQSRKHQPRGTAGDGVSSCSSASSTSGAPSASEPSSGTATPATNVSPVHQQQQSQQSNARPHGHKHRHGQRTARQKLHPSQQPSTSSASGSWRSRSKHSAHRDDGEAGHGPEQTVALRIISPRGGMVDVEVLRTLNGRQLKMHALEKFASNAFTMPHFSSDLDELADRYRIIRSHSRRIFRDDELLANCDVQDEEEFLLVAKRIDPAPLEESLKGPSAAEILAATRHIPLSRINQASVNFNLGMLQSDLQQDLRRIMISLSKASAYVHGTGPCAEKLIALFHQRLINRKRHQISSVETLLEMGFSLDKINQALQITKNVFPAALDWLIQNDSTAKLFNCDKSGSGVNVVVASSSSSCVTTNQMQPTTVTNDAGSNPTMSSQRGRIKSDADINDTKSFSTPSSSSGQSIDEPEQAGCETGEESEGENGSPKTKDPFTIKQDNVAALLEIVRMYSEKTVVPAPELVISISEMGFEEESVREALVATHNNQAAACEWLLGNRVKSVQGLNDGLPDDSPILRVLMASPQVQISLGNPKMFIALISMLDNSSTMTMWLSDNDTSSVLGHILRTYHEEKHIVAINQFNNAQGSSGQQQQQQQLQQPR
ncbi:ubiquitin-associated domain-containing protein 1 [Anopheles ziemanni]|uniref:ubiquitin-associated domain-containing protein 1 n=1 Tax=Anopheles coustani TaxID=139045 RepID=UPI0026590EE2|nr:ubiquitin-associated domain-containing protein 1 [Anopheles coustani]XP_058169212.1 ubiquitin-associated domain-containing protein 1 [Anopheles ziemanni]